jgi:hypothetical protein
MADDIRAFSRKKRPVPHGLVEEEQPALTVARIEGIEVFPGIQGHVHWVGDRPARASGQQRGPKVDRPRQRLGCDPIAEVRGTGRKTAGRGSRAEDLCLQQRGGVHGRIDRQRGGEGRVRGGDGLAEGVILPGIDLRERRRGLLSAWRDLHHVHHLVGYGRQRLGRLGQRLNGC